MPWDIQMELKILINKIVMECSHCGKELSLSVYNADKTMKSCPRCSQANGQYHVFHPYPSYFGTTGKRSSSRSPEGAQSYCTNCRGDNPPRTGTICTDITDLLHDF